MNPFNDPPKAWPETAVFIIALLVLGVTVYESLDWIATLLLWSVW